MKITRRQFVRGGVAAFTVSFAVPEFLSDLARAQGARSRNLVVFYLGGGNDSLSMLIPYNDAFYYSRRPTLAVPAGSVLQIGSDSSRVALGLHPRLTGLKQLFDQGRLAFVQRTGYANQSRHLVDGRSEIPARPGLGRTVPRLAAVSGRPTGGLERNRGLSARPSSGTRAGSRDRQPRRLCVLEPKFWRRGSGGTSDGAAHQLARARRSSRDRVRLRECGGCHGHLGPRGHGRAVHAVDDISEYRPGPGPPGGCRRDGQGHRH